MLHRSLPLLSVALLALLLSGCDKCGNWARPQAQQACQETTPR